MKKYNIILADPPWSYKDKRGSDENGSGSKHGGLPYPSMPTEQIMALPVKNICCENSILFIWITFPNLPEVFKVIPAWGFTYKTLGFAWIKTNKRQNLDQTSFLPETFIDIFFGIGFYTKSNCEICLIAVNGKASELVIDNHVPSTIIAPLTKHSEKPPEARKRIEQLCGNKPRLEMFARKNYSGWDAYGNQVKNSIKL